MRHVLASRSVQVEVIVIDDGSRDRTSEIVREQFGDDPRVRLLTLENGGKARALNKGLEFAKGEIVIAASQPITGIFAFAGTAMNNGLNDFVLWKNANGGVAGRKLRYVSEDSGFKLDQGVAIFKKLMASDKPTLPLHADGLLVTGVVTRNMARALRDAYEATPEPKVVIAVGDCALTCGMFAGGPGVAGPVADFVPVDVEVAGCPPTPEQISQALRRVTGR